VDKKRLIASVRGLLVARGAANVYAQDGAASDATAVSASASSIPKAIRTATRQLGKTVRRALVKVKELNSSNVVVVAKGGVILLGGSVPDASQIDLAVSAAKGVNGVSAVSNSLTIKAVGQ
jgi:osmotically-inducible protein OsmY